jgi:ribulose-5-phosphate 4-epimerase/fuculose-1-phosphate aldolase
MRCPHVLTRLNQFRIGPDFATVGLSRSVGLRQEPCMSAVHPLPFTTRSGLVLNPHPQRKDWFDEPTTERSIVAERRHRQERLAGAFRLFARYGFDQGLAGHITARDPELLDHFWVNPFGLHFSRIRVSDLLLVNAHGEIAIGEGPLNRAAFAIHAAIHEARPEVVSAAHTHSLYGKAWSSLGRRLAPLTQDSCAFYQDHGLFEDFGGVVYETTEGAQIAQELGAQKGVILKNHGILTAGPSVEAAAWWYIALDNACHTQLLAEAAGMPQPIAHEQAALTHSQISSPGGAARSFDALWQGLVAAEPELLT